MAGKDKKEGETSEEAEKPKSNKMMLIVVIVVVLVVGGGAGVFLAPKFMAPPAAAAAEAAPPPPPKEEPPLTVQWPPLVVDVYGEGGGSRHVKMVITLECEGEGNETKARAFSPRARAKVLEYVREQSFESLTDSSKFAAVQEHVTKLVKEASADSVKNVWITDFVAQ